jgi:hypothetical protein
MSATAKTGTWPDTHGEMLAELADRRRQQALARLRQQMEFVETLDDPDLLEEIDGVVSDALYDLRYPQRRRDRLRRIADPQSAAGSRRMA